MKKHGGAIVFVVLLMVVGFFFFKDELTGRKPEADAGWNNTLWAVRASFKIRRLHRLSRGSADPREP